MPIVVTIREDVYPLARFQDNPDTLYNGGVAKCTHHTRQKERLNKAF
jgi:hypothetical protein